MGREIKSAFWGKIEEIPNIYVDNFENKNQIAYFLSHNHSDHTKGLYFRREAEALRSNGAKIYMSEETQTLLEVNHYAYQVAKLYDIVEPLKVGMTYTIDLTHDQSFQVTVIPVTHMIGAVMFLFKTNEQTILYTGDFLIEEDKINELTKLHDKSGNRLNIDSMYVDATFDNDNYKHFPSRSLGHKEVVNEIKNWLKKNDRKVILHHYYRFGYDDIYKEINKAMDIKLFWNDKQTRNSFSALYGDNTVLTGDSRSKIHICNNIENYHDSCRDSTGRDVLHIYISAGKGCYYYPERRSAIHKDSEQSLYLCYPTHCSKSQLDTFITYFSPNNVVKFPKTPMKTPTANTPFKEERNRNEYRDRDKVKKRLDANF